MSLVELLTPLTLEDRHALLALAEASEAAVAVQQVAIQAVLHAALENPDEENRTALALAVESTALHPRLIAILAADYAGDARVAKLVAEATPHDPVPAATPRDVDTTAAVAPAALPAQDASQHLPAPVVDSASPNPEDLSLIARLQGAIDADNRHANAWRDAVLFSITADWNQLVSQLTEDEQQQLQALVPRFSSLAVRRRGDHALSLSSRCQVLVILIKLGISHLLDTPLVYLGGSTDNSPVLQIMQRAESWGERELIVHALPLYSMALGEVLLGHMELPEAMTQEFIRLFRYERRGENSPTRYYRIMQQTSVESKVLLPTLVTNLAVHCMDFLMWRFTQPLNLNDGVTRDLLHGMMYTLLRLAEAGQLQAQTLQGQRTIWSLVHISGSFNRLLHLAMLSDLAACSEVHADEARFMRAQPAAVASYLRDAARQRNLFYQLGIWRKLELANYPSLQPCRQHYVRLLELIVREFGNIPVDTLIANLMQAKDEAHYTDRMMTLMTYLYTDLERGRELLYALMDKLPNCWFELLSGDKALKVAEHRTAMALSIATFYMQLRYGGEAFAAAAATLERQIVALYQTPATRLLMALALQPYPSDHARIAQQAGVAMMQAAVSVLRVSTENMPLATDTDSELVPRTVPDNLQQAAKTYALVMQKYAQLNQLHQMQVSHVEEMLPLWWKSFLTLNYQMAHLLFTTAQLSYLPTLFKLMGLNEVKDIVAYIDLVEIMATAAELPSDAELWQILMSLQQAFRPAIPTAAAVSEAQRAVADTERLLQVYQQSGGMTPTIDIVATVQPEVMMQQHWLAMPPELVKVHAGPNSIDAVTSILNLLEAGLSRNISSLSGK